MHIFCSAFYMYLKFLVNHDSFPYVSQTVWLIGIFNLWTSQICNDSWRRFECRNLFLSVIFVFNTSYIYQKHSLWVTCTFYENDTILKIEQGRLLNLRSIQEIKISIIYKQAVKQNPNGFGMRKKEGWWMCDWHIIWFF